MPRGPTFDLQLSNNFLCISKKVDFQTYVDFEALYWAIQKVDITDYFWSGFLFW